MPLRKPNNQLEEYKVWPAVGAGSLVVFVLWGGDTIYQFFQLLESNADRLQAIAFPVLLGCVFAFLLQAKYWLGFIWLAVASSHVSILMSLFDLATIYPDVFITLVSLVVMFTVQGGAMYAKRRWQLKGSEPDA